MGGDELVRESDRRRVAQRVLLSTKALVFCERSHDFAIDNQDDETLREAYAAATAMFNRGDFPAADTREEVVAAIEAEMAEAFIDCPACDKIDSEP